MPKLRNNPAGILSLLDEFGKSKKPLITIGHDRGQLINSVIAEHRPKVIVELGGYVGYSAIAFGAALKQAGGHKYYSLELDPVMAAIANLLLDLAGLRDVVQILVGPAHVSIGRLVNEYSLDEIDLLFVDHWKDRYLPDLRLVESLGLIRPGKTVVVADNVPRLIPTAYLAWVKATEEEKRKQLQDEQLKPVRKDDILHTDEAGLDAKLENVAGQPEIKYETKVYDFEGGPTKGVSIAYINVSCIHMLMMLLCILGRCCDFQGQSLRQFWNGFVHAQHPSVITFSSIIYILL